MDYRAILGWGENCKRNIVEGEGGEGALVGSQREGPGRIMAWGLAELWPKFIRGSNGLGII